MSSFMTRAGVVRRQRHSHPGAGRGRSAQLPERQRSPRQESRIQSRQRPIPSPAPPRSQPKCDGPFHLTEMCFQNILEEEHLEFKSKASSSLKRGPNVADQRKSSPIHMVQNDVYPPTIGRTPTRNFNKFNIGSEDEKHDQRPCSNCFWSKRSKRLVGTYMQIP
jgi:hypothetical protein